MQENAIIGILVFLILAVLLLGYRSWNLQKTVYENQFRIIQLELTSHSIDGDLLFHGKYAIQEV